MKNLQNFIGSLDRVLNNNKLYEPLESNYEIKVFDVLNKLKSVCVSKTNQGLKHVKDFNFEVYNVLFERLNIGNSDSYLNALKLINDLYIEEIFKKLQVIPENTNSTMDLINQKVDWNNICDINKRLSFEEKEQLEKEIFDNFFKNFDDQANKNSLIISILEEFYSTMNSLQVPSFLTKYEILKNTEFVVFCLTKEYANSLEFKEHLRRVKMLKKKIFFVKMEDFDLRISEISKFYEINKHIKYNYEGYITRQLANSIASLGKIFNYEVQYKKIMNLIQKQLNS